jgi:hypothetical protein
MHQVAVPGKTLRNRSRCSREGSARLGLHMGRMANRWVKVPVFVYFSSLSVLFYCTQCTQDRFVWPILLATGCACRLLVLKSIGQFDTSTHVNMTDIKEAKVMEDIPSYDKENVDLPAEKKGTVDDQRDMFRMGKAQEMRVRMANRFRL